MAYFYTHAQCVLLFVVLTVNSVQFQILRRYTLLLKSPILMCSCCFKRVQFIPHLPIQETVYKINDINNQPRKTCALTSQNGDGVPACVIWFTLCVWSEVDMKGCTHLSSWRLWFTCNAVDNSWAPSSEIWLTLRLQNVREQEMRDGSTNIFTLCKATLN